MQKQKITYESVEMRKGGSFTVPWILAAIFTVGALVYGVWQYGPLDEVVYEVPQVSSEGYVSAYDAALLVAEKEARAWQSNAVVASFESLEGGTAQGGALAWRFVFTSISRAGEGYIVDIQNGEVIGRKEGAVAGRGSALPQNAKTADEAIAEVAAMPGRENAVIHGVEAVSSEGVWYWGIRTDKGTISVRMEK